MNHRILYLHETACMSGAEESLLNLMRALDKTSYTPLAVLPEEGPFANALRSAGIILHICPMPRIRALQGVADALATLARISADTKASLIHSNSIRTHLYGAYLARRFCLPLVWHERNLITHEWFDPDLLCSFLADRVICNSRAILRRFRKEPDGAYGKFRLVYNGVDTQKYSMELSGASSRAQLGIKDDETVIGIASRLGPGKGHHTFLEAARLLLRDHPGECQGLRFLIVGSAVFGRDQQIENRIREHARTLGAGDKIVFTGLQQDMPLLYAAMDIFVLASEAEPCGRVILESMACGKPTVGTNTGGTPEIALDGLTGYLVPPGKPELLAQKLLTLIQNPALRNTMGQEARKRVVSHFTIERNATLTQDIYKELLDKKQLPGHRACPT